MIEEMVNDPVILMYSACDSLHDLYAVVSHNMPNTEENISLCSIKHDDK